MLESLSTILALVLSSFTLYELLRRFIHNQLGTEIRRIRQELSEIQVRLSGKDATLVGEIERIESRILDLERFLEKRSYYRIFRRFRRR